MTYKIGFLVISLVAASIVNCPIGDFVINPNKVDPSFTFIPDPDISSFSSFPFISTSTTNNEDYFSCDKCGPFSLNNAQDFQAVFEYELYSVSSQSIIERIRVFNSSNSVVASSSKTPISYVKGTRKAVTFTVPFKDYWSVNGLTLKFEICNSSHTVLKTFSATFYPPSKKNINGSQLKREIYTSKSLGFYGDGKDMKEVVETFDFTTLGDYVGVDYYYRLNLLNNYFRYPQSYLLNYNSVSLRFNDDSNLFPYYSHQDNGDIIIPLSLYKNGDNVSFKYKNTFYINKRTLQISDTYRTGFVSTRDFYLPINGKKKFNNKQLYIDIDRLGMDEISSSLPIKYDIARSLTGVCTDGEYCIVGGNR